MKNKIISVILICVFCLILSSCEAPYEAQCEYSLSGLLLGDHELDISEVYPEGGSISLGNEGEGKLRIGQRECNVTFSAEGENIAILINGAEAKGAFNETELRFVLEGTDLTYIFSSQPESGAADFQTQPELTDLQKKWNRTWEGFVIFSEPTGEWEYLESSIMHVSASSALDSEGNGAILMYTPAFSDTVPAIALNLNVNDYKAHQTSGYFFDFVCEEGDVSIELLQRDREELFSTEFIHPEEYSWYIPDQNILPVEDEPEITDVICISGKCIDEEGGFEYTLELSGTDE